VCRPAPPASQHDLSTDRKELYRSASSPSVRPTIILPETL
jgi:hypothetical protein